ncbi:MAG: hypothetical protein CMO55_04780 [Verrucomicrobiales bacterium]|nr:hypothetical protein [Verrucomicrobiales bacterium]
MKSLELKWGLIIGAANMVWLFGSYYLGMHTNGIGMIQILMFVSMVITLFGYVMALRELVLKQPDTTYIEGLKKGVVIAGVAAAFAVFTQLIYHKLVFPGFTEYMVGETRKFYESQNVPAETLEVLIEGARNSFGLRSYMIQSGAGAFFTGCIFSAIIMAFIRRMARR